MLFRAILLAALAHTPRFRARVAIGNASPNARINIFLLFSSWPWLLRVVRKSYIGIDSKEFQVIMKEEGRAAEIDGYGVGWMGRSGLYMHMSSVLG